MTPESIRHLLPWLRRRDAEARESSEIVQLQHRGLRQQEQIIQLQQQTIQQQEQFIQQQQQTIRQLSAELQALRMYYATSVANARYLA